MNLRNSQFFFAKRILAMLGAYTDSGYVRYGPQCVCVSVASQLPDENTTSLNLLRIMMASLLVFGTLTYYGTEKSVFLSTLTMQS